MAKKEVHIIVRSPIQNPDWFYHVSILIAVFFSLYMSIYAAIYFNDIMYMNIIIAFFCIALVTFFIISALYFQFEKMGNHALASGFFFGGFLGLIIYIFNAPDASSMVK